MCQVTPSFARPGETACRLALLFARPGEGLCLVTPTCARSGATVCLVTPLFAHPGETLCLMTPSFARPGETLCRVTQDDARSTRRVCDRRISSRKKPSLLATGTKFAEIQRGTSAADTTRMPEFRRRTAGRKSRRGQYAALPPSGNRRRNSAKTFRPSTTPARRKSRGCRAWQNTTAGSPRRFTACKCLPARGTSVLPRADRAGRAARRFRAARCAPFRK
jgi:hypothetical protein